MPWAWSPRQQARDGVPSAPLLPWSCIHERGEARLSRPPRAGQGGQRQQEGRSPWSLLPKPLEGPTLQLQGPGCTSGALFTPPTPSAPNHPNELSRKIPGLELPRGRGWGEGA